MKKKPTALVSFVGVNDGKDDPRKGEGAILAVFEERTFDKVYLLWVNTKEQKTDFSAIAENVRHKLRARKLCKDVEVIEFTCRNIVDHNTIYKSLIKIVKALPQRYGYTAAISSGTPQMQACWLLLAESGDFQIKLIRTSEKIFGSKRVRPVHLTAALPRIVSLQNKIKKQEKEILELIPNLTIDLRTGIVQVGDTIVKLSPAEFCHYCVLARRAIAKKAPVHFIEEDIPQEMSAQAFEYYKRAFKNLYENLLPEDRKAKENNPIEVKTWRSFVSRINTAFKKSQLRSDIHKHYQVTKSGKRNSTLYSITAHPSKIKFKA